MIGRNQTHKLRDIKSIKELQYHKMRLDLATEILEDKFDDNLKDLKYQFAPRNLFRTLIATVFSMIGRHNRPKHGNTEGADEGFANEPSVFTDGLIAITKALFRASK